MAVQGEAVLDSHRIETNQRDEVGFGDWGFANGYDVKNALKRKKQTHWIMQMRNVARIYADCDIARAEKIWAAVG